MSIFESAAQRLSVNPITGGIPLDSDQLLPRYDGYSIANLPASINTWLGCPLPGRIPLAPTLSAHLQSEYQHVILVVVDGLGLRFLTDNNLAESAGNPLPDWQALLQDALLQPLTSILPSTTAAALTSFWTGSQPVEHGVIGYEVYLREYSLIGNMVTHSVATFLPPEPGSLAKAGFDPRTFLPLPTLGAHFKQHDVAAYSIQPAAISDSGLSQMLLQDVQSLPYASLDELWQSAARIPAESRGRRTYTYVYFSEMDTLSHHTGPHDPQLLEKWREFSSRLAAFVRAYRSSSPGRTLLLLTADHGQVPTAIEPDYDLRNHPDFTRHLVMQPSGEGRLPFLFVKPGREDEVLSYLQTHWNGAFRALPSEQVIQAGLLGDRPPYDATVERTGQLIVFPKGSAYWWWVDKPNQLLGRHGGLSQQEMLVPLVAWEL
ncbi:MAG: hypothetical protein PWQ55_746 [Chloroflexota bacterium]|nr:hypothetical protein [Chloroflexota bacterium]